MRNPEMEFSGKTKMDAMKRSRGACEVCGDKNVYVEIHHKLGIYYASNFYPMLPAWIISSIDNALVVCDDCHHELDVNMAEDHVMAAAALLELL